MVSKIKSLHLTNFKGVADREYEFNGQNVEIKGQNGAGKTTIATAFYWVFADCDYDLHSNPMVRKIGSQELDPTVEIVFDIDGKEVTVSKTQKRSVKKSKTGGNETVSYKNLYEVNGIGFGEKTFKEKMMEYGFDLNLFLTLAHPDVFVGKKADEMRKVLFSMVKTFSDLEIAEKTKGCDIATELLKSYSIEEVKAMQSKKIKDVQSKYGKNGEILHAVISEKESRKTDIDVAELELAKKAVEKEINENLDKQTDMAKQLKDFTSLSTEIMELKFAQGDLKRDAHDLMMENEKKFQNEISAARSIHNEIIDKITSTELLIRRTETNLINAKDEIEVCRMEWKRTSESKFDESSLVCPMCNQELPEECKNDLISEFSDKKRKQLSNITAKGNQLKKSITDMEAELKSNNELLEVLRKEKFEIEKDLAEIKAKHVEILTPINIEETDEWKVLQKQIDDKESVLKRFSSMQDIQTSLKHEESELIVKRNQIEIEISKSSSNVQIDEEISDLKAKYAKDQQIIADAERILYQLDLIGKKKNELLSNEINSNFSMIDFELFKELNNREVKECCIPTFKGKGLNVSTNTGLEFLMKLDILKGLQKFYGMSFPVFIDGAECLDTNSKKNIQMDCQMVYLTVSDDEELKIMEV